MGGLYLEWIGNYNTKFGKHDLSAMGGYSYQEFNNQAFWAENMDFPSDGFGYNNLGAGLWNNEKGRLGMDSWKSKEKLIAFLGRVNYNYDDTYFLTASFRYEGNTKFGKDNKWGCSVTVSRMAYLEPACPERQRFLRRPETARLLWRNRPLRI